MHQSASQWFLEKVADNRQVGSLANRARRSRMAFFLRLLGSVPPPIRILDVGGTVAFWTGLMPRPTDWTGRSIVLLNTRAEATDRPAIESLAGDARDMRQFKAGSFDVVFSNSVIEHVGGFDDQRRMADEIQRIGLRYFVQTPNFWFPLEPHFLFPYFQLLPREVRVGLVRRIRLGWIPRHRDLREAEAVVDSIQLLTASRLRRLFPDATLVPERVLGLTKSWIAHAGFLPKAWA